ncbi:acetyl-CoA synthetase-like protein [Parathielavia appendiculata]|uniref:Acetyl-CoA synthetase-like protein n=1 Tax=Parathielavia appendiculata TaxID=2587402 RepID=A0AAN6TP98_9PEZI|nr:acetyl-CoA synthetase-like protein [Parathielavia appendiculata]
MGVVNGDLNYFTCTLGQAAQRKDENPASRSFRTVIELVDLQARDFPHSPALGFADFQSQPASTATSPQLEPLAIDHLCEATGANAIFSDERHLQRLLSLDSYQTFSIPFYGNSTAKEALETIEGSHGISEIAYYVHTSGTSSGLPKPIPQTHQGVVGVVPRLPGYDKPATFTTTPLYHGGLADCFRAWASGAAVWFFPEGVLPITRANLLNAIRFAGEQSTVPVRYFTSVPYILQMMAEADEGVQLLRTMDLVGVGGAALPAAVGDKLVQAGVNLVSRLGSAECGFLASSHRKYAEDKEWQYLRLPITDTAMLTFEPREGRLSELVAQPCWPFLARTNRSDGSYATSDLFDPHTSIPNAWRYHSRADAQITLVNGKKFDPAPLEGAILASTNLLQDVVIVGNGKEYTGLLLFPSKNDVADTDLIEAVWPTIQELNRDTQSYARIVKTMLVPVRLADGRPLDKSSKGTILRRQVEERYRDAIESAYQSKEKESLPQEASDTELLQSVLGCFSRILGRSLDPDVDLYQQGVDSIAAIQIRKSIESLCLPQAHQNLPINVLYDLGTINAVVAYLQKLRRGMHAYDTDGDGAQQDLMRKFVNKYGDFHPKGGTWQKKGGDVVVLTGATGFLGAYILHLLRHEGRVRRVYCLVREETPSAAHQRVTMALSNRGMLGLDPFREPPDEHEKIICLPCRLSNSELGLSAEIRRKITEEATLFIHSAWTVNFNLRLSSLEDQLMGMRNLIDMAAQAGARFAFVSSIAAVACSQSTSVQEKLSQDPSDSSPLGYSRSKWVAEHICAAAHDALATKTGKDFMLPPISVIRAGQLCSNEAGIWNASEAYPLMLSTAKLTGCLPDLPGQGLNWLPVDMAAQAVLDIALSRRGPGDASEAGSEGPPVYHVLNPHKTPTWNQMLHWILEDAGADQFAIVSPSEWVERLETANRGEASHPSHALLGLWKESFVKSGHTESKLRTRSSAPNFDMDLTRQVSDTIRQVQPLDRRRVVKMWKWINQAIVAFICHFRIAWPGPAMWYVPPFSLHEGYFEHDLTKSCILQRRPTSGSESTSSTRKLEILPRSTLAKKPGADVWFWSAHLNLLSSCKVFGV